MLNISNFPVLKECSDETLNIFWKYAYRKNEEFLKWKRWKTFLFYFQRSVFFIFLKIWTSAFTIYIFNEHVLRIRNFLLNIWFFKFWSSEKNTENTMSHLYFNEESDYSEENTCDNEVICTTIVHHRRKLNIFTFQLPIYCIQY